MALFGKKKRLIEAPTTRVQALLLGADLDRDALEMIEVVGESNYQEAISLACGRQSDEAVGFECVAALVAEPTNPHDPSAIMVQVDGHHVGYLSRKHAILYHPIAEAAARLHIVVACNAYISAHDPAEAETRNAGVFLHLPAPDGAAEELADYSREVSR